MDGIASRVLGWAGAEPEEHRRSKIFAAWVVVSLHMSIRFTLSTWYLKSYYLLPLIAILFGLGLVRRFMRPVACVFTAIMWFRFSRTYPDVSNHYLVECLCVLVFAMVDLEREDERELCLRALCWIGALVLFMSGLQKLLHGAYFEGQYLSYMVANTDRFRDFFSPILSSADLDHLASLKGAMQSVQFQLDRAVAPMPGPYRVDSTLFVIICNSIWIGEMLIPLGLLWRRTRRVALIGAVIMMLGIVASSREFYFDTLFLNLLLLFARTDLNRKLLPISVSVYAYYLMGGFGIVNVGFVW